MDSKFYAYIASPKLPDLLLVRAGDASSVSACEPPNIIHRDEDGWTVNIQDWGQ